MKETRLEIALKVLQWSPEVADLNRVAGEFGLSGDSFNTMSEDQFFQELFMYVNDRNMGANEVS